MDILDFVIQTLLNAYIMTFLLRFLLQWARADFHNPLSQFIVQITNPLTRPARRIIPGWRGLDFPTLVIAYLLSLAGTALSLLLMGGSIRSVPILLYMTLIGLVTSLIIMMMALMFAMVIFSWFAPDHPVARVLYQVTAPVLRPIRRVIPPIAGFDLSVLFAFIGLQVLLMLIGKI